MTGDVAIQVVPASCVSGVAECDDTSSTDGTIPWIGALLIAATAVVLVIVMVQLFRRGGR
jgi:hypothetical protein